MAEGAEIQPGGTVIAELEGSAAEILMVERTMLNLMSRMSGIATTTRRVVEAAKAANPKVRIAGTRKTAPGLRLCDKQALVTGGADPHRMNLSDMILIKDNHLTLVPPLEEAVQKARAYSRYVNVEVEVETAKDALTAARSGADIILLDNMSPPETCREHSTYSPSRASGNRSSSKSPATSHQRHSSPMRCWESIPSAWAASPTR